MQHTLTWPAVALGIGFGLFVAACAPAPAAGPAATPAPVKLKVVSLPFIAFAPFWIAADEGYFTEQNLQVEFVDMTQQQDTLPALVSGQVDVTSGQVAGGIFNTIGQAGRLKIVADKGYIDPNSCPNIALIARNGLNISPDGAANQLRGRKISVASASWNEYYLDRLLQPRGLQLSDFEVINVPSPSQAEALRAGQIDLVVQNEPWVTRLAQAGNPPILTPVQELMPNSESAVTVFGDRLLGEHADVGKRFMVAYLEGVRMYNGGKTDRTVSILAKYTQLDQVLLKGMCWPALRADGQVNLPSLMDFQEWAVSRGVLDATVPPDKFWDPTFVDYAARQLSIAAR